MPMTTIPCDRRNYGGLRGQPVEYVVIHYTAGNGDTAVDNGRYFGSNETGKTSAHYFVDEKEIVASVPEDHVAWHCGAAVYRHPNCRNSNAIGVELCSIRTDGVYDFKKQTVENGARLAAQLLEKYDLPPERLLRHYDVTGKCCPAPMVGERADRWQDFLRKVEQMTQEQFEQRMAQYLRTLAEKDPGDWSADARAWAEQTGLLQGDSGGMRYKSPVTREELTEILYRYQSKEER